MKSRKGLISIAAGVLLVIGALVLTAYNIYENDSVQRVSSTLVSQLEEQIPEETATEEETEFPYYMLEPDMEMPTQTINSNDYIGILYISTLGVELPIISACSESALKTAPCRYFGSVYTNDLVIAGHNYRAHFGSISNLNCGDEVTFTDIDGNMFLYEVVEKEVLPANAVEEMTCGDWNLTLFTCNYGGAQRVTIRCDIKDKNK